MSSEDVTQTPTDTNDNEQTPATAPVIAKNPAETEKEQEAKLRAKYPGLRGPGGSTFLQKRLSKGQKYFDSGDYNVAKAKMGPATAKVPILAGKPLLPGSTGDAIPTPEMIPHRKPSLVQSKLASGQLS